MTALQTLTTPAFHPGPMADRPDPEVPERARRRTFTARYKIAVLAEYDAAEPGAKGAILRREGLYSSHLVDWRRQRDAGALAGLSQPRGRRPADARETEIARLRTEKAKLEAELAKAQFVIDVQGKLQARWERLSESAPTENTTPPSSPGSSR
jgi:transposase